MKIRNYIACATIVFSMKIDRNTFFQKCSLSVQKYAQAIVRRRKKIIKLYTFNGTRKQNTYRKNLKTVLSIYGILRVVECASARTDIQTCK